MEGSLRPSTDCSPYKEKMKCGWKNSKLIHSSEGWIAYEMQLTMCVAKEGVSSNLSSITVWRIPWENGGHSWLFIAKHWVIMWPLLNVKRGSLGHLLVFDQPPHVDWARIWCQINLGADPLVVGRPTNFINAPFSRRAGFFSQQPRIVRAGAPYTMLLRARAPMFCKAPLNFWSFV